MVMHKNLFYNGVSTAVKLFALTFEIKGTRNLAMSAMFIEPVSSTILGSPHHILKENRQPKYSVDYEKNFLLLPII